MSGSLANSVHSTTNYCLSPFPMISKFNSTREPAADPFEVWFGSDLEESSSLICSDFAIYLSFSQAEFCFLSLFG